MDCDIVKDNIQLTKTVIDGFAEEKVDFDIIIPDYCSAASKILKCEVVPSITSKVFENDRLIADVICSVTVIYIDEITGVIRSICESTDFKQTFSINEELDNYRLKFKIRASGVICRLQNSRRISVKALIGIAAKGIGNYDYEHIIDFENCQVESKFENLNYCAYVNCGNTELHISGEVQTKNNINEIIKYFSDIRILEAKSIKDKVIIKGEAKVTCIYTSGEDISDLQTVISTIPFNDVIEVYGSEENSVCDICSEIISVRCDLSNSPERNTINVDIEAICNASMYKNRELKILKDVYSKKSDVMLKNEVLELESLEKTMNFSKAMSEKIEIDIENAIIDDIQAKAVIKNISSSDSALMLEGDIFVSVLAHNNEEYRIYDKIFPFSVSENINFNFSKFRCEAEAQCKSIDYFINAAENMDIDLEFSFNVLVFCIFKTEIIKDLEFVNNEKNNNSKVILYFADEGELLWDIAKKYKTSIDILKRDNDIDGEKVDKNCMLLISSY